MSLSVHIATELFKDLNKPSFPKFLFGCIFGTPVFVFILEAILNVSGTEQKIEVFINNLISSIALPASSYLWISVAIIGVFLILMHIVYFSTRNKDNLQIQEKKLVDNEKYLKQIIGKPASIMGRWLIATKVPKDNKSINNKVLEYIIVEFKYSNLHIKLEGTVYRYKNDHGKWKDIGRHNSIFTEFELTKRRYRYVYERHCEQTEEKTTESTTNYGDTDDTGFADYTFSDLPKFEQEGLVQLDGDIFVSGTKHRVRGIKLEHYMRNDRYKEYKEDIKTLVDGDDLTADTMEKIDKFFTESIVVNW